MNDQVCEDDQVYLSCWWYAGEKIEERMEVESRDVDVEIGCNASTLLDTSATPRAGAVPQR